MEASALRFHFACGLPGARDDFPDPAHGLGIRAHHADGTQIMEDVLGGDGFTPDPASIRR
jgi:hypothetical protein